MFQFIIFQSHVIKICYLIIQNLGTINWFLQDIYPPSGYFLNRYNYLTIPETINWLITSLVLFQHLWSCQIWINNNLKNNNLLSFKHEKETGKKFIGIWYCFDVELFPFQHKEQSFISSLFILPDIAIF